ncbi:MAG: T9SS type A sorting domain-containing protein [Saprospiraceae bacterium]
MFYKYYRVLLLCLLGSSLYAQNITTQCDGGETTSPVAIQRVQLQGFALGGESITDVATFNVPANSGACYVPNGIELTADAGVHFEFDVTTQGNSFAYQVLVDWNNDGVFNLEAESIEITNRGTSNSTTIRGSFFVPQDTPRDYLASIRIMVAEDEDDLGAAESSNSVIVPARGGPPQISVSKTGSGSGILPMGKVPCYEFKNCDEISFFVELVDLDPTSIAIDKIELKAHDSPIVEYTIDFSNNELFLRTGTGDVPYVAGTSYPLNPSGTIAYEFVLKWNAIRTSAAYNSSTLKDFPLNSPQEIDVCIFINNNDQEITSSLITIGCPKKPPIVIDDFKPFALFIGATTTIEVISSSYVNRLVEGKDVFLLAGGGIEMKSGVYEPLNAVFMAESGRSFAEIPQLTGMSAGALSIDEDSDVTTESEEEDNVRREISLKAFPNPFNQATILEYQLRKSAMVEILLYDLQGQLLRTLVDTEQTAGIQQIDLVADDLTAGIYICSLEIDGRKTYLKIVKS